MNAQRYIESNNTKHLAYSFLIIMLIQMFAPTVSYALTSGPTQPEVQGFTQYGTTDMVDPFTGSFSYNIPLLEIPGPDGGYPINLAYNSGISMDQEASWVGLGWNLNVGCVNRDMRGLPDDFDGDEVMNKKHMMPNTTIGVAISGGIKMPDIPEVETAGAPVKDITKALKAFIESGVSVNAKKGMKFYYNTYNGFGYSQEGGFGLSAGKGGFGASIGLNMSQDYFEGGKISPTVGISYGKDVGNAHVSGGLNLGMNFSSRYGLTGVSLDASLTASGGSRTKKQEVNVVDRNGNKTREDMNFKVGDGASGSMSVVSTSFGFSGGAQAPSMHDEMKSSSFSAALQIGGQVFVTNIDGEITGFWNKEELAHNNEWVSNKAFGYNYLQDVKEDDEIMDFNRGTDQPVSPSVKTIAQPNLTYDIFSVKGQGIGSMLRPYRSDIGMLRDNNSVSDGWGASLAVEVAVGNLTHGGGSGFGSTSDDYCGQWKENNDINDVYKFKQSQPNNPYFQPVAYQSYGEKHALDITETNNLLQGFKPTYINLSLEGGVGVATNNQIVSNTTGIFTSSNAGTNVLSKRIPRNISIQHFKNAELNRKDKVLQQFDIKYSTTVDRAYDLGTYTISLNRKSLPDNQLGGFEAINTSGIRYIYGIPAYNLENLECTYTAKKESSSVTPLYEYKVDTKGTGEDPDHDIAGYEKFLEKNKIPKYAHSFLLSSVLGTDYIDIDNNGVSENDLGYWVKFNYLKANGDDVDSGAYQWRAPFTGGNLNEKLVSKNRDDVGTYTYGKRENWYIANIETKTHVAEFYISTRHDAKGALKEIQSLLSNGNINSLLLGANSYKLDSIKLYTKPERYINGVLNSSAIPLKVVHFEYAGYPGKYESTKELCRGIENTDKPNGGKLTLKSIWFSYKNNYSGKSNGYVFDYNEEDDNKNPNYAPFAYNRWGDYQPEDEAYTQNKYFPYVRQDLPKNVMDERAAVWSLKQIELPTGAKMNIHYEANDYAYVQNKPAMQMYKVLSVGNQEGIGQANQNYVWSSNRVYFDIPDNFSSANEAKQFIENNYLDNTNQLYFKIKVDLTGGRGTPNWEFVSGYAPISSVGAEKVSGDNYVGYIVLDRVNVKKLPPVHPFAVTSWNYLLMNRPEIIQGENAISGDPENTNKTAMTGMMLDIFMKSIMSIIPKVQNYYVQATENNFGLLIDLNSSFIRLNNVNGHKYGGGVRVKEIELIGKNGNNEDDTLGTVYDYTTIEKGKVISSGVAAYEPIIGGDENALKKAIPYENKVSMTNYIPTFTQLPINESYYPSPSVGYSKVTIRSKTTDRVLNNQLPSTISTTGQTVNEYYTAKDFPTASSYTPIVPVGNKDGNLVHYTEKTIIPLLGGLTDEQLTISQGFYTEINDMHGKPKSVITYAQNVEGRILDSAPISYQKYIYKTIDTIINDYPAKKVNNIAKVMYNDTTVSTKLLGVDFEYFGDTRISESVNENEGLRLNIENFMAGPAQITFPVVIPSYGKDEKTIRLAANNKIIHRFGILDSVIQMGNGSVVKTSNELYDANTGEALLTKLNDEYGNSSFNYTQPAYWQYDGMGPAYKNIGLTFDAKVDSLHIDNGNISLNVQNNPNVLEQISNGDELAIMSSNNFYIKAFVAEVDYINTRIWIKTKGQYGTELSDYRDMDCSIDCSYPVKLIRSGRKNLLSVPAGTIVSKVNPVTNRSIIECK